MAKRTKEKELLSFYIIEYRLEKKPFRLLILTRPFSVKYINPLQALERIFLINDNFSHRAKVSLAFVMILQIVSKDSHHPYLQILARSNRVLL